MRIMLLCAVSAAITATPAFADQPGPGWIGRAKVAQVLKRRGYTMTRVEADDGHWEGEAVRRGRRFEFHVNPHTGAITKLERDRD